MLRSHEIDRLGKSDHHTIITELQSHSLPEQRQIINMLQKMPGGNIFEDAVASVIHKTSIAAMMIAGISPQITK